MKKIVNKWALAICFILGVSLNFILAQEQDSIPISEDTVPVLPTDEITVIKDFQARLMESKRVKILAALPVFQTKKLDYIYDVNVRALALEYPAIVIKPIAMSPDEKLKAFSSYIKLAYGYPHFSTAEIMLSHRINKKLSLGLSYEHIAARHNEYISSRFNRHLGEIYASYSMSDFAKVKLAFFTDFDRRDIITSGATSNTARSAAIFGSKIRLTKPVVTKTNLDYSIDFIPYILSLSDLDARESGLAVKADLSQRIQSFKLSLELRFDRVGTNLSNGTNLSSMQIVPSVHYNTDYWNAQLGGRVLFENGSNFIYPELSILRQVIQSKLYIGLFAKSNMTVNSYKNTLAFNPYINMIDTIRNEKKLKIGANVEGKFDNWRYQLELGYKWYQDILNYELIGNLEGDEDVLWNGNSLNAQSPFLELSAEYELTPSIKFQMNVLYQNMKVAENTSLNGYYNYRMGIGTKLNFLDRKLQVFPGIDFYTGLQSEPLTESPNFYDLHLDIQYQLFERIAVFVHADNLLNRSNQRWNEYSALGIAANGGIKIRF